MLTAPRGLKLKTLVSPALGLRDDVRKWFSFFFNVLLF